MSADNLIHWEGESQLLGYGESDSTGAWIKLRVTPEDLERFRGYKGTVFHVVTVEYGHDGQPVAQPVRVVKDKRPPNKLAESMVRSGYFRNPKLWSTIERLGVYTQDDHKKYIESLPCCMGGEMGIPCSGDVVLHHIRSVSVGSGTGIKPPHWYGIPLCHAHHTFVHGADYTRELREYHMTLAIQYTADRMKSACKVHLGISSLSEITDEMKEKLDRGVRVLEGETV